ncbi:MAG: AmmeMemoRadiSam system radical SAM enzyme [Candidatus Fermentibacteraceae bacterium]
MISSATPSGQVEARYYTPLEGDSVRCGLCFRGCVIPEGERGFCSNRKNRGGTLYTLVYNRPCALQVDPIEKEPMYHFLPGTLIYCAGTASCTFTCLHCHNWHMSQRTVEELRNYHLTPEQVVDQAEENGCDAVSFTYNEPTVFYEYMYDVVLEAKKRGLRTIFHTNGSMAEEPLRDILEHVDGVTVDLKAFSEGFYDEVCGGGDLEHVLSSLRTIREEGVWLEIVYLVIPTLNDDPDEIRAMCRWVRDELGPDVPVHFSRFSPSYRLTRLSPTPISTLEEAYSIAREAGLEYVTLGNVPGHVRNSTFCPRCTSTLIERTHFQVNEMNMHDGACDRCGLQIPGVWE